ncbi:MAG: flagellar basal body rod protein FlgC [Pseudomonadota bacterium]
MDLLTALKISASGLAAQRTRMNVVSSNLANIETTRTLEGGPYRAKSVVLMSTPVQKDFKEALSDKLNEHAQGVEVVDVIEDKENPKEVFNPTHPDADERGIVLMPNVNLMEEMVDMLSAVRAYEANVTAINATKSMAMKTLEIGR